MTSSLFFAAAAATCADFFAWLLLIQAGRVAEGNPLVASLTTQGAAGARLAVVVLLGALAVLEDRLRHRGLTIVVRLALAVAIVIGVLGAASTIVAIR